MKTKINKKHQSILLDEILDSISPKEQARIDSKMILAKKIDKAIKSKGWKKKDLAQALEINNQSIITKWLSGTHNFTTDTLTDIQNILEIDLLNLDNKRTRENVIVYRMEVATSKPVTSNMININDIQMPSSFSSLVIKGGVHNSFKLAQA